MFSFKKKFAAVALSVALVSGLAYAGMDTIKTSGARTSTYTSNDQYRTTYRGVHVILNVTAVPGVETLTMKLQGLDNVSGSYYDLLVGNASATTGMTVLKIMPGAAAAANSIAADSLPDVWRVIVTHSAAGSFTYSVSANTLQ